MTLSWDEPRLRRVTRGKIEVVCLERWDRTVEKSSQVWASDRSKLNQVRKPDTTYTYLII